MCKALKVEELEQRVLPLYQKNRIDFDVYTYMMICKLHVTMRDLDSAKSIYLKSKEQKIKPNKVLL